MSYYGKLCTLMYDIDKPFLPENELSFYKKYLYSKDVEILEPMCGSGRFFIPIKKQVDNSILIEYWKVEYLSDIKLMDYKLKYELVNEDKIIEEEYMDFPIKLHSEKDFVELLKEIGFRSVKKVSIDETNTPASEENMLVFECKKK